MPDLSFREATSNADKAAAGEFYEAHYLKDPDGEALTAPGCPAVLAGESLRLVQQERTRWVVGYGGESLAVAIPVFVHPYAGVHVQVLGWASDDAHSDEASFRTGILGLATSLPWPGCCNNTVKVVQIEHEHMSVLDEFFGATLTTEPFSVPFVTMPDAHPLLTVTFQVPKELTV